MAKTPKKPTTPKKIDKPDISKAEAPDTDHDIKIKPKKNGDDQGLHDFLVSLEQPKSQTSESVERASKTLQQNQPTKIDIPQQKEARRVTTSDSDISRIGIELKKAVDKNSDARKLTEIAKQELTNVARILKQQNANITRIEKAYKADFKNIQSSFKQVANEIAKIQSNYKYLSGQINDVRKNVKPGKGPGGPRGWNVEDEEEEKSRNKWWDFDRSPAGELWKRYGSGLKRLGGAALTGVAALARYGLRRSPHVMGGLLTVEGIRQLREANRERLEREGITDEDIEAERGRGTFEKTPLELKRRETRRGRQEHINEEFRAETERLREENRKQDRALEEKNRVNRFRFGTPGAYENLNKFNPGSSPVPQPTNKLPFTPNDNDFKAAPVSAPETPSENFAPLPPPPDLDKVTFSDTPVVSATPAASPTVPSAPGGPSSPGGKNHSPSGSKFIKKPDWDAPMKLGMSPGSIKSSSINIGDDLSIGPPQQSFDIQYHRQKIEEQKNRFLTFGELPSGFEFTPGWRGRLGSPGAVEAAGATPLGMGSGRSYLDGLPSFSINNPGASYSGVYPSPSGAVEGRNINPDITPYEGEKFNKRLIEQRASFFNELDQNPQLRRDVIKTISMENNKSPEALADVLESMANRAHMRGYSSLSRAIHDGFYGPVNRGGLRGGLTPQMQEWGEKAINMVRSGRNNIEYRTDQGMLTDPGARRYMQMPDKSGWIKRNGENYFLMDKPGRDWYQKQIAADKEYIKNNTPAGIGPFGSWNEQGQSLKSPGLNTDSLKIPDSEGLKALREDFKNYNPDIFNSGLINKNRQQLSQEEKKFLALSGYNGTYGNGGEDALRTIARKQGGSIDFLNGTKNGVGPNSDQVTAAIKKLSESNYQGLIGFSDGGLNIPHILRHPEFLKLPKDKQDQIKNSLALGAPELKGGKYEDLTKFGFKHEGDIGSHMNTPANYARQLEGLNPTNGIKPIDPNNLPPGISLQDPLKSPAALGPETTINDQLRRAQRIQGTAVLPPTLSFPEGNKYQAATGGGGKGSMPFSPKEGHVLSWQSAGSTIANFHRNLGLSNMDSWNVGMPGAPINLNDPLKGGRSEIQIHAGINDINRLYTAGCLGIPKDQWPQFTKHMKELMSANGGKLALHFRPSADGKYTFNILPIGALPEGNAKRISVDQAIKGFKSQGYSGAEAPQPVNLGPNGEVPGINMAPSFSTTQNLASPSPIPLNISQGQGQEVPFSTPNPGSSPIPQPINKLPFTPSDNDFKSDGITPLPQGVAMNPETPAAPVSAPETPSENFAPLPPPPDLDKVSFSETPVVSATPAASPTVPSAPGGPSSPGGPGAPGSFPRHHPESQPETPGGSGTGSYGKCYV